MPSSVVLPKSQALAVEALIGSGSFKTQSEILRSSVEDFIQHLPKPTRLSAAIWAYQNRKATLSKAAELAGIDHGEMQRILVREGVLDGAVTAKEMEAASDFLVAQAEPGTAKKVRKKSRQM